MRRPVALLSVSLAVTASTQVMDSTEFNVDETGLAIGGYDPVAYFTLGKPTPGRQEFAAAHNGVAFRFASLEHRDLFLADPDRYVPAYGAWCAWAASRNSLAAVDPTQFVIHDGRLFLNYNARLNRKFGRDLATNVNKADSFWPELSAKAAAR